MVDRRSSQSVLLAVATATLLISGFVFCTAQPTTVRDADGNTYRTVKIGTQTWMAENLRTTKYRDGSPISLPPDDAAWGKTTEGAYAFYDNDPKNGQTYGLLYNGYAILNPKSICPAGWHVPAEAEWKRLIDYLGGNQVAGGKMKDKGNVHWHQNVGANNESGFSALPGGVRFTDWMGGSVRFDWIGLRGFYASSTEWGDKATWYRDFQDINPAVGRDHFAGRAGLSVRCIKD